MTLRSRASVSDVLKRTAKAGVKEKTRDNVVKRARALLMEAANAKCKDTARVRMDALQEAIAEMKGMDKAALQELLEATLQAQAQGLELEKLPAAIEKEAWEAMHTAMAKAEHEANEWYGQVRRLLELAMLLSRGAKDTAGAAAVLRSMHSLFHVRVDGLKNGAAALRPEVCEAELATFLRASSIVSTVVECSDDMMCMAKSYFHMKYGLVAASYIADAPHIPLEACIDDVYAIVPDGENADIFIQVSRADLLRTSFRAVMAIHKSDWANCSTLDVLFEGENGYGEGVVRDWLGSVAHELFYKTEYFVPCPEDPSTVHPAINLTPDGQQWMQFAGRVMGMAIKLGIPLGVRFSEACLLMVTSQPVSMAQLREVDPLVFNTCRNIAAAGSQHEIDQMFLDGFCSTTGEELFPGGQTIRVTHENREHFVDMLAAAFLLRGKRACTLLASGIINVLHSDTVNEALIAMYRMGPKCLNDYIGGVGFDKDLCHVQWREHTVINFVGDGSWSREHEQSCENAFFEMIRSMTKEGRARLFRFWTGLHSLPGAGFLGLPGKMRVTFMMDGLAGRMPSAHTCMMSMELPGSCNTLKSMKDKFGVALRMMEFSDE